jgi:hypothetical protein
MFRRELRPDSLAAWRHPENEPGIALILILKAKVPWSKVFFQPDFGILRVKSIETGIESGHNDSVPVDHRKSNCPGNDQYAGYLALGSRPFSTSTGGRRCRVACS